jgi:hypothetical protein
MYTTTTTSCVFCLFLQYFFFFACAQASRALKICRKKLPKCPTHTHTHKKKTKRSLHPHPPSPPFNHMLMLCTYLRKTCLLNFSPSWHFNFFFSSSSIGNVLISLSLSLHRIQFWGEGGSGEGFYPMFWVSL